MAVAALGPIIEDYMAESSTRRQALSLRDEPSSQVFEPVWALLVTTSHGLGNLIAIFIGASDARPDHSEQHRGADDCGADSLDHRKARRRSPPQQTQAR